MVREALRIISQSHKALLSSVIMTALCMKQMGMMSTAVVLQSLNLWPQKKRRLQCIRLPAPALLCISLSEKPQAILLSLPPSLHLLLTSPSFFFSQPAHSLFFFCRAKLPIAPFPCPFLLAHSLSITPYLP